jgi:hypothetical protein
MTIDYQPIVQLVKTAGASGVPLSSFFSGGANANLIPVGYSPMAYFKALRDIGVQFQNITNGSTGEINIVLSA